MPIYEYECSKCGHSFDQMQRISDDPLTTCPNCQEDALSKLISAPSFKLKGSGWYETDFKNKGNTSTTDKSAKAGTSKTESKDSSKSSETNPSKTNTTKTTAKKDE